MQKGLTDVTFNIVYCVFDLGLQDVWEDHPIPLFMDASGDLLVNTLTYYTSGLSIPVLGPTQPPIQWVPGLSRG
jgi:hypothetical protein